MKNLFLFFILFSAFFSCDEKSEIKELFPLNSTFDTVTFNLPSQVSMSQSGTFLASKNVNFYFSDSRTKKCIYYFDHNFQLYKTIPLDFIKTHRYTVADLEVLANDSILVLTDYLTSKLIHLNSNGEIKSLLHLADLQLNYEGIEFEFQTSTNAGFAIKNGCIFQLAPTQESIKKKYSSLTDFQLGEKYYELVNVIPRYVKIDYPFDSKKRKITFFQQPEFIKKDAKTLCRPTLPYYYISNKEIIESSAFEPGLIHWEIQTKKDKFITFKPKYTKFGSDPLPISMYTTDRAKINKDIDSLFKLSSRVNKMFFDKSKNRFHFFMPHRRVMEDLKQKRMMNFSWFVFDENLNVLNEQKFSTKNYIAGASFMDKNYIYVLLNDTENEDYNVLTKRFVRFKL